MTTKQEYLLSVPFDYIIGFSKETGLIRNNRYFTKKDYVHRLVANLETSECRQIYEDHRDGQSYKTSVTWYLSKFPSGQSISKSFVENQNKDCQHYFFFEFPISKTRVDVLGLLSEFHAYEVKSERDKFDRLTYQIPALKLFFENISLIIPYNKSDSVTKIIDETIGVIAFSIEDQKIAFDQIRSPLILDEYNSEAQLQILQVTELQKIYSSLLGYKAQKMKRIDLMKNIIAQMSRSQINDSFKICISNRQRMLNRAYSQCRMN